MNQALFPMEERERRLRIIQNGIKEEFWKVTSDSMLAWCAVKSQEAIELSAAGQEKEAERLSIEIQAVKRIVAEPATIIRINQPLFDRFHLTMCKACGHVVKKIKDAIGKNEKTIS